jgi:hypothetical protein
MDETNDFEAARHPDRSDELRIRDQYGLMMLRLIRQLPKDNPVRKAACDLLVGTGFVGPDGAYRFDDIDVPDGRRCPKCGSPVAHYRTHGYRCLRGCPP